MPARPLSGKKPKNLGYTLRTLLSYLGRHKYLLLMVAVLVTVSALANLLGTYMIRPVVNALASGGTETLLRGVLLTAAIYLTGALASLGYTQTMVKAAQKVLFDIRRDLFAHLQTLPLRFFDTRRHGDVMSYFIDAFTNVFLIFQRSNIVKTTAFRYFNVPIIAALEAVGHILHKQQCQNVILITSRFHTAPQFIARSPYLAVNFALFDCHRYLSVLFLISCQVPIYSSGGTGMYTIFRGIILRYLTLSWS